MKKMIGKCLLILLVLNCCLIGLWLLDGGKLIRNNVQEQDSNDDFHKVMTIGNNRIRTVRTSKKSATTNKNTERIIILGAGPTGLGAAYRLHELLRNQTETPEVVILEMEKEAGGLANSYRDPEGFLWDNGGHVVFSHYGYFDRVLKEAVKDWNKRSRASYAYMMGSSKRRSFIPYPVQHNIHVMDNEEQQKSLMGLEEIAAHPITTKPKNFDEWLVKNFGEGLSDVFMRKYNQKVWTVDPKQMNRDWVGERVAVPNVTEIKTKMAVFQKMKTNSTDKSSEKDSNWGPNQVFQFPTYSGTGGIWQNVSKLIPQSWFHFGQKVTKIDTKKKIVHFYSHDNNIVQSLKYDSLISTIPLDYLLYLIHDDDKQLTNLQQLGDSFVFSHTHVIGIGLNGQPPKSLADKSWIYFPDSDSPFYRITVFSNYADDNVPRSGSVWSLMCEAAEPKYAKDPSHWTKSYLIKATITALINYGFIRGEHILSSYHRRLEHGYPVPFLKREEYLRAIQPWLELRKVYSRGRFGGWRYEVSNQDHSLMQGVEIADRILCRIPEVTYPNASFVNTMKAFNRSLHFADHEFVVAHYDKNLAWMKQNTEQTIVYSKGGDKHKHSLSNITFKRVEALPNIGRESHTYLHHIIENYHCLADCTVFLQDDTVHHAAFTFNDVIEYTQNCQQEGFKTFTRSRLNDWGKIDHIGKWLTEFKNGDMKPTNITLGEFWIDVFDRPHPQSINVTYCAAFAVSRKQIHKRPKSFFEKLITLIDSHPNPEVGHYFERLWIPIFTDV